MARSLRPYVWGRTCLCQSAIFSSAKMKNIVRDTTAASPHVYNDDKHLSSIAQRTTLPSFSSVCVQNIVRDTTSFPLATCNDDKHLYSGALTDGCCALCNFMAVSP